MDTRTALLDAALNRFSAFGYDGTAVQEICDDCALTKPTLYHHFSSKRGLLDALLAANFRPFRRRCKMPAPISMIYPLVSNASCAYFSPIPARTLSSIAFSSRCAFFRFNPKPASAARPYIQKQEEFLIQLFKAAEADHGNMRGHSRSHALSFLGCSIPISLRP